jgi:hypothetical protein
VETSSEVRVEVLEERLRGVEARLASIDARLLSLENRLWTIAGVIVGAVALINVVTLTVLARLPR